MLLRQRFTRLRAAPPPPPGRKVTDPTAWRPYRSRGCDALGGERPGWSEAMTRVTKPVTRRAPYPAGLRDSRSVGGHGRHFARRMGWSVDVPQGGFWT